MKKENKSLLSCKLVVNFVSGNSIGGSKNEDFCFPPKVPVHKYYRNYFQIH